MRKPRFLSALLIALLMAFVTTSCEEVLQYPEPLPEPPAPPEPPTGLVIHLHHDTDMPLYQSVTRASAAPFDVRHIVRLYPATRSKAGTRQSSRGECISFVDTHSADVIDRDISIEAPEGDYDILVWTDYVAAGTAADLFYNTADFALVTLAEEHVGNEPARQAFYGTGQAIIEPRLMNDVDINLVMPMARFRIIANDIREFADKAASQVASGRSDDTRGDDTRSEEARSINPDDYEVRVAYTAYMPSVFNMFIDHPTDSRTGVSFAGEMNILNDEEVELGHDFVLTNGAASSVDLAVEIYDRRDHTLLARSPLVNIPLLRSHLTEVRGRFLTAGASGSTAIYPNYWGDFNIEIK